MNKKILQILNFFKKDYIILFIIFLALSVSNLIWLKIDIRPPHWDASNHLMHSLAYFKPLINPSIGEINNFLLGYVYYPPFVYWITSVFYLFFGKGEDIAVLSNIVFFAVLIFSTYGIGKQLWDRKVGLLSALVVSVTPVILSQSREYQLDFPLTAMVALSFYLLLKTEKFKERGYSIFLGVISAFGFLTKWTFPSFLLIPLAYFVLLIVISDIREKKFSKGRWLNIFLSLLIFLVLADPWYIKNAIFLKSDFLINVQTGIGEGDPQTFLPSLFYYLKSFTIYHTRILLLLPFLVGLLFTLLSKKNFKKNLILILFLISGWLILSLYSNKDTRFMEPLMPAVAIIVSFWVFRLSRKLSLVFTAILILISIFNFWTISFGLKFLPRTLNIGFIPLYRQHGYFVGHPKKQNWRVEIVLDDILTHKKETERVKLDMLYPDKAYFNKENFNYYTKLKSYPIDIKFPYTKEPEAESGDFLVVNRKNREEADKDIANFSTQFVKEYRLPDKTKVFLYQVE